MSTQHKGKYIQRVLTPDQQQSYDATRDIDLSDLGINHNIQQGRPPRPPSRSQWARPSQRPGPLTRGPNPIYFNPEMSAEPYRGDNGTMYPGEDNIFPPNRQGDLPDRFAPMPVGLNQIDTTPQHIQEAALDAFLVNPYPKPSFAPVSPVYPSPSYPSSPIYLPERSADAANKSVVSSIGDWVGSMGMGEGGKTRKMKKKGKGKRKSIRKLKSKKSKKSRRR